MIKNKFSFAKKYGLWLSLITVALFIISDNSFFESKLIEKIVGLVFLGLYVFVVIKSIKEYKVIYNSSPSFQELMKFSLWVGLTTSIYYTIFLIIYAILSGLFVQFNNPLYVLLLLILGGATSIIWIPILFIVPAFIFRSKNNQINPKE